MRGRLTDRPCARARAQGLSDSLLRVAARRQRTDALIVYGGLTLVLLLTLALFHYR